jgi:hypothetical protein
MAIDFTPSEFIEQRRAEKKIANEFQKRRHLDWNDNYELNRNKVKINRLTQRQAVNIPLMKETLKTLLSKIDDPPSVEFRDIDGDEYKELLVQEMWNDDSDRLNFQGIDLQDKKTVLLYGRAFKKLNWTKEGFTVTTPDIFDIVIDPLTDPLDLETARFIIHQNIYRSLREVLADPRYTKEGKDQLKQYLTSTQGIIQSGRNREEMEQKNERMKAMGVKSSDFPMFAGGDQILNLSEHICEVWDTAKQEFVRYVVVYADDMVELYRETLEKCLGIEFFPYVTWGDDIETNDFWSDGVADLVRTPNKVLNVWYSQMVENRTLGNFNMVYYDATNEDYKPSTYEPGPGLMIPAPGDPNKTLMPVPVQKLDDNMNAIQFLTTIVERATAATAIDKGVQEGPQTTLGEVQILVGKAMERTQSMAKFYNRSWQELATKWYALLDANQKLKRTIYKQGTNGKLWPKPIYPSDWRSKQGFKAFVKSSSEQEQEKTKGIQQLMFIKSMFPTNMVLSRITQNRSLQLVDLTPAELREIEDEEKHNQAQQQAMAQAQPVGGQPQPGAMGQPKPTANPQPAPDMAQIQNKMQQLSAYQNG